MLPPRPSKLQERHTNGRVGFCGLSKQFGIPASAWPAAQFTVPILRDSEARAQRDSGLF